MRARARGDEAGLAQTARLILVTRTPDSLADHAERGAQVRAAGVASIAYTSILNPVEASPAGVVAEHSATEEKLREAAVEWAVLRPSIYADLEAGNLAAALATGKLVTNGGLGRVA